MAEADRQKRNCSGSADALLPTTNPLPEALPEAANSKRSYNRLSPGEVQMVWPPSLRYFPILLLNSKVKR